MATSFLSFCAAYFNLHIKSLVWKSTFAIYISFVRFFIIIAIAIDFTLQSKSMDWYLYGRDLSI